MTHASTPQSSSGSSRGGLLAVAVLSEVGAEPGPYRARPGELLDAFAALDVVAAGEGDGQAWLVARAPAA